MIATGEETMVETRTMIGVARSDATDAPAGEAETTSVRRAVGASTIGTIVEWYDFFIYGNASALVFGPLFFPSEDPLAGILASYAAYALGFMVRPIGGLLFGYIGDKRGRKPVLIATLMLMGLSTVAIGFLPTYQSIGIWAPVLLLLLRILQGLGSGAEYAGAVLVAGEYSVRRRGFFAAFPAAAVDIAIIVAAAVFAATNVLPNEQFLAWGWRIPFLLAIISVVVGYFVRRRVMETPEFTALERQGRIARTPVLDVLREQPRAVFVAMGVNVIITLGYVYQVWTLTYITNTLGLSRSVALNGLIISAAIGVIGSLAFGALSDRIGRRAVMMGGALFTVFFAFPFFWMLGTRDPLMIYAALTLGLVVGHRTVYAAQASFYVDLFKPQYRYSGIALAREPTLAFIGGPLPLVATALVAGAGGAYWPMAIVMMVLAAITAVAVAMAPKTASAPPQ
jgi:MFS transporter, MHS family, shikimate and dehydroshikimate transport protein